MNRITDDLLVRHSEHNEGSVNTLEELSLHQQHLGRIEYINRVCAELKVLYLQDNCIPRIEGLSRLRRLEILNLSINNIQLIENLSNCESLRDLDLTLNFVFDLVTSVENLRENRALRRLNLMGNPCAAYSGYRDYVLARLPWLTELDGKDAKKAEKIEAGQKLKGILPGIVTAQEEGLARRQRDKETSEQEIEKTRKEYEDNGLEDIDNRKKFFDSKSRNTPEYRSETSRKLHEFAQLDEKTRDPLYDPKAEEEEARRRNRRLFTDSGRPLNINEAKIGFHYDDSDDELIVVELKLYKHLDPADVQLDIEPLYLRARLKGKLFQMHLMEEIRCDASSAARSQTTGHLRVVMPRLKPIRKFFQKKQKEEEEKQKKKDCLELLEVKEEDEKVDLNIVGKVALDEPPPLEQIEESEE